MVWLRGWAPASSRHKGGRDASAVTRYIEILANHAPIDFNEDEQGRVMWSINIRSRAQSPVTNWEGELASHLNSLGYGTLGTDMFIGRRAVIPEGDGPFVHISNTGGLPAEETHDGGRIERMTAQITVIALSYTVGHTRALAIFRTLDGLRETTLTA